VLDFVDADGDGGGESPELAKRYLWGPAEDQLLVQENYDAGQDATARLLWGLADHLGSPRDYVEFLPGDELLETEDETVLIVHFALDSFGNILSGDATEVRYIYTAQEYDAETGFYYYDRRYVDPSTGRFISEDFVWDGYNKHAYVGNAPTMFVDADGLQRGRPTRPGGGSRPGRNGRNYWGGRDGYDRYGNPMTPRALADTNMARRAREAHDARMQRWAVQEARAKELLQRCVENALKNGVSGEHIRDILNRQGSTVQSIFALRNELGPHVVGLPVPANRYLDGLTPLPGGRKTGVDRATRLEVELIRKTGRGSWGVNWTAEEIAYIKKTGCLPRGVVGHHINSVNLFPEWQGDPRNIIFLRDQKENFTEHRDNYRNPTMGPFIDRQAQIDQAKGGK
jgi:RHS repeat-associated protein